MAPAKGQQHDGAAFGFGCVGGRCVGAAFGLWTVWQSEISVQDDGWRDLVAGGKGTRFTLRGEAVAVDLPDGRTLFALLRMASGTSSDDNVAMMSMMTMDPMFDYDWMASTKKIVGSDDIKSPVEVSAANYPMLVMFKDVSDPTSVELVDPRKVGVKRIVVEVTEEPVTASIDRRLAAMGIEPGRGLDRTKGVTANPTLAQKLGYNDFTKGHQ